MVRPVVFLAYSGTSSWRTSAGEEFTARLGEPLTAEQTARAWRTALDPGGEWIPAVLAAADRRLTGHRNGGMPDAGGLVIASDQTTARAYAEILRDVTGTPPVVVLSDEPGASDADRARSRGPTTGGWSPSGWCPRASTCRGSPSGVYATSASTPLFFAQAVGRFVRSRRAGETASVFLPSVPVLLGLASELEAQRDHVLGKPHRAAEQWDDEELAAANRQQDEPGEDEKAFTALHADAELDQLIYDGTSFSADEEDFIGLPGLLEPDQVRTLLSSRQQEWLSRPKAASSAPAAAPPASGGAPAADGARAAERAAQGAEHPRRPAQPPHEEAARDDPQRAPPRLRRPPDGDGEHRAARGAHRHPPLLALTREPPPARARRPRPAARRAVDSPGRPARGCARVGTDWPANVTERVARSAAPNVTFAGQFVPTRAQTPGTAQTATGREPRSVPAPSWRCEGPARVRRPESARLHLDVQLAHLVAVGACVVPAEEQLSTGGQDCTDLGGRSATVTAVGGGQLGPGKGSRLHSGLPPSRHRVAPVSLDATNRLRGTSTLADARHPGSDSRRASRHPSRRDRLEVRPPSGDRPGEVRPPDSVDYG